jgi:glycine cleavage system H protein
MGEMATDPVDCLFHEEHMWVRRDKGDSVIGITSYAQQQLGEVSFVDLPAPGTRIARGQPFGTVESAKVASDLIAPVSGEVLAVNGELAEKPWLVNNEPYAAGWILRLRAVEPEQAAQLLTFEQYTSRFG